jgi:predicted nucleic acid-binding protein
MASILWDTNLFIYLFEDHPRFAPPVAAIRDAMVRRSDHLFATAMTLGEILVKPLSINDHGLERRYRDFFQSGAVKVLPFDDVAATHYARIRCDRSIQPPDAIQLACAAAHGIDLFITNDERLSGKVVAGVSFITSLQAAPL